MCQVEYGPKICPELLGYCGGSVMFGFDLFLFLVFIWRCLLFSHGRASFLIMLTENYAMLINLMRLIQTIISSIIINNTIKYKNNFSLRLFIYFCSLIFFPLIFFLLVHMCLF